MIFSPHPPGHFRHAHFRYSLWPTMTNSPSIRSSGFGCRVERETTNSGFVINPHRQSSHRKNRLYIIRSDPKKAQHRHGPNTFLMHRSCSFVGKPPQGKYLFSIETFLLGWRQVYGSPLIALLTHQLPYRQLK